LLSSGDHKSPKEIAGCLCRGALNEPEAIPLAEAWFSGKPIEEGDGGMDWSKIAWFVGAAAAAVVVAIKLWVRRGGKVEGAHLDRPLEPSADFRLLLDLSLEQGEAGPAARKIRDQVNEPWNWRLKEELKSLGCEENRRLLLSRFAAIDSSDVQRMEPEADLAFDPATMEGDPAASAGTDDVWVVAETTAPGFKIGAEVVEKASVRVATWDSRVLLDDRCPVGRVLLEQVEELIPGGGHGCDGWRATWGLSHPEDLRTHFGEAELDTWRNRMVRELNAAYAELRERRLLLTGQEGALFEPSTMEAGDDAPVGDAIVERVVNRDGVPQHGLACPGGSPLLLAVVKVKPSVLI